MSSKKSKRGKAAQKKGNIPANHADNTTENTPDNRSDDITGNIPDNRSDDIAENIPESKQDIANKKTDENIIVNLTENDPGITANSSGSHNPEKSKQRKFVFREKKKRSSPVSFSITFQISAEQLLSNVLGSILVDLAYVALMTASVIYDSVVSVNGTFSGLRGVRFYFGGGSSISEYLRSAAVSVTNAANELVTVPVGNHMAFLGVSLIFIVMVQFILLIAACVIIPGRTYERLKPLYTMTEAARALKDIDITGSDFTSLENAITELSPGSGELAIHTGKEELAGLEEAINDLLERTRSSYQSQIRFVSDASHELRTPIAVIRGYADMLERWGSKDKEILEESITSIKSEAENMSRLVENLLFLARGDSGRAIIRFEEVDINALICDIYDEFTMIDKTHEFRLDLRADIKAQADPSLIKQCLRILVDNAIKYSPEGTDIILRLQNRGDDQYSIEVQDNGIGIKQEEITKIFERFYRSDPARSRQSGGYGLGLSIAKWIADKHSGFFEVLSYENLGTRISLVLPSAA